MHITIGIARVTDPQSIYENAFVEMDSSDDVTVDATVRNRQGVNLVIYSGPFEVMTGTALGGWIIHTSSGDVEILRQEGCGCGGTSIVPRPETVDG